MWIKWSNTCGDWPWGKRRIDERAGRAGEGEGRLGKCDHAGIKSVARWIQPRATGTQASHPALDDRSDCFPVPGRLEQVEGIEHCPSDGPAIVMINHIALVDPVMVLGVLPRNIVPMAKVEVYRVPVFGIFPWLWEVIPVHRGEMDRKALRSAEEVLRAGEVVLVAPEGTRHPSLQAGKEGVAFLRTAPERRSCRWPSTARRDFPLLPFLPRWRGPGVRIRVGKPFRFVQQPAKPDREMLRRMTDQAMGVLASMLPEGGEACTATLGSTGRTCSTSASRCGRLGGPGGGGCEGVRTAAGRSPARLRLLPGRRVFRDDLCARA